jgi:hypothetical protein
MSHRSVASRNLPLETDHDRDVDLRLPDVVIVGFNTSLEPHHPLENNIGQNPPFDGPNNAFDRR